MRPRSGAAPWFGRRKPTNVEKALRLAPEHPGEVAAMPGGWLLRQHLKWPKPWCPAFLRRAAGARLTSFIAIRGRKSQDGRFFLAGGQTGWYNQGRALARPGGGGPMSGAKPTFGRLIRRLRPR